MKKLFSIMPPICKNPAFAESSAEELRVLVALIESGGAPSDIEKIASLAGTSVPRTKSAIAFWESANIIAVRDTNDGNIEEEFGGSVLDFEPGEMSAADAAFEIRDKNLAIMIEECGKTLGKPALSTEEIKKIVALKCELGFDEEFILTLAAYVAKKSASPTVQMLARRAKTFYEKNINTSEKLEAYIKETEEQIEGEMELRRALGIYRPLTKSQRAFAEKWLCEYGYGLDIIGEAYDITVSNIDKVSFAYMDTLISAWYEAGCKTVSDCQSKTEADRLAKKQEKSAKRTQSKKDEDKPRYGNFDAEDVFARALERSYGTKS